MNDNKMTTNKVSKKHKYRVSIYLGKEGFETLTAMAHSMQIPLASATRIIIDTGLSMAKVFDRKD